MRRLGPLPVERLVLTVCTRWVCVAMAGTWLMLGAVWNALDRGWFALASAAIGLWFLVIALTRRRTDV